MVYEKSGTVSTAMTEHEVPSPVAQGIIIKYLTNEGVKPSEILTRLTAQFGDSSLSQNRVYTWAREFKGGRDWIENESHNRRPRSSFTDDNIRNIRHLIEGDRRLTVDNISSEVGISYGSVQSIITDKLGFRKIGARWVPSLLTANQKQVMSEIIERFPNRFQHEGQTFLKCIVTCDET